MTALKRRDFLRSAALAAGGLLLTSRIAFAGGGTRPRFVFVILRGALDGLTAVPPYGDPHYARLRGEVAIAAPGATRRRAQARWVLWPASEPCVSWTNAMAPRNSSCCTRLRARIASARISTARTCSKTAARRRTPSRPAGSTARSPHCRRSAARGAANLGIALGQNVPLVMRGSAPVASWSPSHLAALDEDTLQRIADLYSTDPMLSQRLAEALATQSVAEAAQQPSGDGRRHRGQCAGRAGTASRPPGAGARARAVLPTRKSCTRRRGSCAATMGRGLRYLTRSAGTRTRTKAARRGSWRRVWRISTPGLRTSRKNLGPVWRDTVVMIATEFGRTAAVNGTRGTDHGTAAAAFLVGGAVRGGRVIADWPGLAERALYQGRDLAAHLEPARGAEGRAGRAPGGADARARCVRCSRTAPRRSPCRICCAPEVYCGAGAAGCDSESSCCCGSVFSGGRRRRRRGR